MDDVILPFFCRELNYFRNGLAGKMSCNYKTQVTMRPKPFYFMINKTVESFLFTIRNVWFLFLVCVLPPHHPSTIASIAVWTQNVLSVLSPTHTLQLLWIDYTVFSQFIYWKLVFCSGVRYMTGTCVAGMCWMASFFSKSQMTMRPRP